MTAKRRDDIYYTFRKARFQGFTWIGACAETARALRTSERAVRIVVIRHGEYK
jgi:hypothetical protein